MCMREREDELAVNGLEGSVGMRAVNGNLEGLACVCIDVNCSNRENVGVCGCVCVLGHW